MLGEKEETKLVLKSKRYEGQRPTINHSYHHGGSQGKRGELPSDLSVFISQEVILRGVFFFPSSLPFTFLLVVNVRVVAKE